MRFLLEQEIFDDVDVITEKGRTALHHAAFAGSLECCLLLIDNGSKLTLRDQDNRLPIDYALGSKESEVVLLLLKSGSPYPSNSTQDDEGRSQVPSKHRPMKLARRQFFESRIIAGELEHCKSIATQDFPIDMVLPSCGRCTPLFAAIRTGQKDIVNWLIAKGAKPMDVFCHHSSHNEVVTLAASLMNSAYCINGILSSGCLNSALWSMSLTNAIYQAVGRGSTKILLVILQHLNRNLKTY
jgi:ankyrin repeat protein